MSWPGSFVRRHPIRLVVAMGAVLVASWALAAAAIVTSFEAGHETDVTICRSLNELRRQIYIAAIDLGASPVITQRFLPTENCEKL